MSRGRSTGPCEARPASAGLLGLLACAAVSAGADAWPAELTTRLGRDPHAAVADAAKAHTDQRPRLDILVDWLAQDGVSARGRLDRAVVRGVVAKLGRGAADLAARADALTRARAPAGDERWAALYLDACCRRRAARLKPWAHRLRRVVFTKHYDLGGSHYAYTEGQSDAQAERHFRPGSALSLLEMDGIWPRVSVLLADPKGVIRDPEVSYDGRRILFAWKKDLRKDDYHLYEMDAATRKVRQLTSGLGAADYEGVYLPNGEIVFNSTRCVQTVDCWWTEVSNLYTCDADGRFLRRLSYDQVHTNYPQVLCDGRVVYTRWDYSDRGQIFPQGLFQMYTDGTAQTEFYGNNSWFPTTILHARPVPNSRKVMAVFSGHHTRQKGWLGILDPVGGRQENRGAQLIAPIRETKAVRIDRYGQSGDQFQYPYPLSEREFLVTFKPAGSKGHFAVYFMDTDGRRELLASDPKISCNQPVPLCPRPRPPRRAAQVDYARKTGTFYLHDIYAGPGLAGVPRGAIRKLRVVALGYRAAGVGSNHNRGPAGGALISTPISIEGAWDVKVVLGTTPVHGDGSACFTVPANTPVYFQALDKKGHAAQTMRSWAQLQPGEFFACVGCHESKNTSPPSGRLTSAMKSGPQPLEPWYGPPRGFSFQREIQPILDRHCVRCHHVPDPRRNAPRSGRGRPRTVAKPFDAGRACFLADLGRFWRYSFDRPDGTWTREAFDDSTWKLGRAGFGTRVPNARPATPWDTPEIYLRRTFTLKTDQLPRSPALVVYHDDDAEVYLNGVRAARLKRYVNGYVVVAMSSKAARTLKAGPNTLAVHCRHAGGGQFIDVGLLESDPQNRVDSTAPTTQPSGRVKPAFSLKGAAGRWSPAYLALADRRVANWVNAQSPPSMLPPYHAGAAKSKLIAMLADGHNGVKLSPEELDRIACWIDLLVPCFGDYTEGLSGAALRKYQYFLDKRRRLEAESRRSIEALLGRQGERSRTAGKDQRR